MNIRDTAAWVCGVPQCVEIHYRTHTCQTHDLKPTGFPVPVTIPMVEATLPVNTYDTMAWVHGVPRCVKVDYCTHTPKTHDLKPMSFPVPMTILCMITS